MGEFAFQFLKNISTYPMFFKTEVSVLMENIIENVCKAFGKKLCKSQNVCEYMRACLKWEDSYWGLFGMFD